MMALTGLEYWPPEGLATVPARRLHGLCGCVGKQHGHSIHDAQGSVRRAAEGLADDTRKTLFIEGP
jgi:hypothetical protein